MSSDALWRQPARTFAEDMSRTSTPGFRRVPRVADRLTAAHRDLVEKSLAAERAGDAARALELHSAVPALALRSRHHVLLSQLASLGEELPDWVWARWIAYQATRCEDPRSETGAMQRQALTYALETFHADQLADCHADGGDPVRVIASVAAESWLFHQLLLHELGGLERFVSELASGRLAEHAGLAGEWAGARLGGYLIGESVPPGRLRVVDLRDGSSLEVLDLGAGANAGGAWVLGRLVPSGVDDLLMFDMPPMSVPEDIARDVAGAEHPWLCLKDKFDEGRLVERDFMRHDYEVATDVLGIELLRIGTAPAQLERVTEQLRAGRDEISRAAFRILLRASEGRVEQADASHVAAAILQPRARADARRMLAGEGQYDSWRQWAALVHDPARGPLMELARASRAAG